MGKRICSLLLVVCMVLTITPLPVFAVEGEALPTGGSGICTCTLGPGASGEELHKEGCPLYAAPEAKCSCTVKCTAADAEKGVEAAINPHCPVCGAAGAAFAQCKGRAAAKGPMLRSGQTDISSQLQVTVANWTYGETVVLPVGNKKTGSPATINPTQFTYTYVRSYNDAGGDPHLETVTEPQNAGTYTVTASYSDATQKGTATATFEIKKAQLTITGGTVLPKVYDGKTDATVTELTFDGLINGETLEIGEGHDYLAFSPYYEKPNVGTDKTVIVPFVFLVSVKAMNYSLKVDNYTWTDGVINPATYTAPKNTVYIKNGTASTGTIKLEHLFGKVIPSGASFTAITPPATVNMMDSVTLAGDGSISYTSKSGTTGTTPPDLYKVTITSRDYLPFDAEITFQVANKTGVLITGLQSPNFTYTGKPVDQSKFGTLSVSDPKVTEKNLIYAYRSTDNKYVGYDPPTDAGQYRLLVSVPPENTTHTGSTEIAFEIKRARLMQTFTGVEIKTYDGNNVATVANVGFHDTDNNIDIDMDPNLTNPLLHDSWKATNATFVSKDVGDFIKVNYTLELLDSGSSGPTAGRNYQLIGVGECHGMGRIVPKKLDSGTIDPSQSKAYDGSSGFTDVSVTYEGGIGADKVTGKVSGTTADANAGSGKALLSVTNQVLWLGTQPATNYAPPDPGNVTGGVEITKLDPTITIAAPTTQKAGEDVTVTMTITNPTGAAAGFPAANEVSITADANATTKGATTQTGTTGVYQQTFTIAPAATAGQTVTFTAKVPAATTNYYAAAGVTKALTVSGAFDTQTILSADKADPTYGDSVTLTATVTKMAATDPGTLAGSVQFKKADGTDIGTAAAIDASGKATLTLEKATLPVAAGGHSFTAAFTSTNSYHSSTSAVATVTVKEKPLTITTKPYHAYQYKELPDLTGALVYTGLVAGEEMNGTSNILKATYTAAYAPGETTNTPGDRVIGIGVSGTETNTNYAITRTPGTLTVHPAEKEEAPPATLPGAPIDRPIIVTEPDDPTKRLRVVTAPLIAEEETQAASWLVVQPEVKPTDLMESHEVELQVSLDNGKTWAKATMADVKERKVKVALPILAGTSTATHDFSLYHFADDADKPGEKLAPTYNDASKTLSATVTSLSPFVIVAAPKSTGGSHGGGNGNSGDDDEYAFWMDVKDKLEKADKDTVLKADAQLYDKMPESVMEALRKRPDVTLVISWKGGEPITIPAGKAQRPEAGRIYYPLSLLAQLYKDVQFVAAPINPETGGPGHLSYADGRQISLTGGSLLVVDAPKAQPGTVAPTVGKNAITDPHRGFEAGAYAGTPDAASGIGAWFAALAAMLTVLLGSVWLWKRKLRSAMSKGKYRS